MNGRGCCLSQNTQVPTVSTDLGSEVWTERRFLHFHLKPQERGGSWRACQVSRNPRHRRCWNYEVRGEVSGHNLRVLRTTKGWEHEAEILWVWRLAPLSPGPMSLNTGKSALCFHFCLVLYTLDFFASPIPMIDNMPLIYSSPTTEEPAEFSVFFSYDSNIPREELWSAQIGPVGYLWGSKRSSMDRVTLD